MVLRRKARKTRRQPPGMDIIGVPLDLGVKELGLKLGPDAFRHAGLMDVTKRLGLDACDLGNIERPVLESEADEGDHQTGLIAEWCRQVAGVVAESVGQGRVPVCLGGDHSLTIGSLAGVTARLGRVGCLWLDAHPDANTPETSPSGNIHGMPVAILLGHGPEKLVHLLGRGAKITCEDMALLGVRDIDPGEMEFIRRHRLKMVSVFDVLERGLSQVVKETLRQVTARTRGVHVSIDLDVLHEDIAPGVGLPSRCGFDMREATYICRCIADGCTVTSIDIVGLNPVRDRNMQTAMRAVELLMILLGQSYSYSYEDYLQAQACAR